MNTATSTDAGPTTSTAANGGATHSTGDGWMYDQSGSESLFSALEGASWWTRVKQSLVVGMACSALGWVFILSGISAGSAGALLFGFLFAVTGVGLWVAWSYSIYQDATEVRDGPSSWHPDPMLFGGGSFFIAFVGWYYMLKRASITSEHRQ